MPINDGQLAEEMVLLPQLHGLLQQAINSGNNERAFRMAQSIERASIRIMARLNELKYREGT